MLMLKVIGVCVCVCVCVCRDRGVRCDTRTRTDCGRHSCCKSATATGCHPARAVGRTGGDAGYDTEKKLKDEGNGGNSSKLQ